MGKKIPSLQPILNPTRVINYGASLNYKTTYLSEMCCLERSVYDLSIVFGLPVQLKINTQSLDYLSNKNKENFFWTGSPVQKLPLSEHCSENQSKPGFIPETK